MDNTPIYLHADITVAEVNKMANRNGLRLTVDHYGHILLTPIPLARLPTGRPYVRSENTDVRATFAHARAQQHLPASEA